LAHLTGVLYNVHPFGLQPGRAKITSFRVRARTRGSLSQQPLRGLCPCGVLAHPLYKRYVVGAGRPPLLLRKNLIATVHSRYYRLAPTQSHYAPVKRHRGLPPGEAAANGLPRRRHGTGGPRGGGAFSLHLGGSVVPTAPSRGRLAPLVAPLRSRRAHVLAFAGEHRWVFRHAAGFPLAGVRLPSPALRRLDSF